MKTVKALLDGVEILDQVYVADRFFTRLRGLMFRRSLEKGAGMLLRPCSQIHTCGMKMSIDAVFLTKDCEVVCVRSDIAPRRFLPYISKSRQVLELAAGAACSIKPGSRIVFTD